MKRLKRATAILLTLTMFLTMAPAASFAAPVTEEETNVATVADDMATPKAGAAVYVSASGSDESGNGSERDPYASLAKAVKEAEDGAIIYVMSDLTANTSARYWDKHLTITSGKGGPFTITRGDNITEISDLARQDYNGALLEVGGASTNAASLTLTNIVLNDAYKRVGEYYIQADSEGDGKTVFGSDNIVNTKIVQDAIIATYNGTSDITLGAGAVLKNFGGMSALRLSGGTVTMKSGSAIYDDAAVVTDRNKGTKITGADEWLYGPAGAVWIQGGTFTMEQGSYIGGSTEENRQMIGRAIYIDSGEATVNGTIQNVKSDGDMWQGRSGVAIHLRAGARAVLGNTGVIDKIVKDSGGNAHDSFVIDSVAMPKEKEFAPFVAESGSKITNCKNLTLVHNDDLNNNYVHPIELNGTISHNTTTNSIVWAWYGLIKFGPTCVIENNTANGAGGLIYSNNGSRYEFSGKIINNTALNGAVYLANQSGGQVSAVMQEGALISGNSGLGVRVNNSSQFTMNGGEISNNGGSGVKVSGKNRWKGVSFIMNGGKIINNESYGIDCVVGGNAKVAVNAGIISGNGEDAQINVWNDHADSPNAYAKNAADHFSLSPGVLQGEKTVQVQYGYDDFFGVFPLNRTLGVVTLDDDYAQIGISFAKHKDSAEAIQKSVTQKHENWKIVGEDAYWFLPSTKSLHFHVTAPSAVEKGRALYAAYIPMKEDGTPADNAEAILKPVKNVANIEVTMDNLTPNTAYAMMFVMSDEYLFSPDDITIYTGGAGTDESETNGLPEPTMDNSLPESISSITINEVPVENQSKEYLRSLFAITYVGDDGQPIINDNVPGVYRAKIALSDVATAAELTLENDGVVKGLKINGNTVKLVDGELTIRYVSNVEDAVNEKLTTPVQSQVSEDGQAALAAGKAFAVIEDFSGTGSSAPKFYTNGNENAELEDVSGVSLFFDDLLPVGVGDDTTIDRTQALKEKADAYLSGKISNPQYDLKYLDLVDQKNGNAWVASDSDITIHWPLPAGINEETKFTVLHFTGLHREYGAEYTEAELKQQINDSVIEEIEATVSGNAVTFTLPGNETQGSFSPFALVWQGEDEPVVTTYTITATAGTGGSITPSGAVTVEAGMDKSFTIKADAGYTIADVKVDGISVGAVSSYSFEDVAANHTIEATFESSWVPTPDPDPEPTPDPDEPDTPDEPDVPDVDLPDDLNTVDHFSYVVGYEDGTVMPQKQITRAEVATIFYRLLKDDVREDYDTTRNNFSDVTSDSWYNQTVSTLASMGILKGYEDGTFRPNASITRAEFAAIATRFFEETGATYEPGTFTDVTGDEWFAGAIMDAVNLGLIGGYEDGTVRPNNNITRAEACAIVNRTLGRVPDADHLLPADEMTTWPDNPSSAWFYADMQEATNGHEYEWITEDGNKIEEWTDILDKDWNDR